MGRVFTKRGYKMKRLIVIGLGGIGSHLMKPLLQWAETDTDFGSYFNFVLVDGDHYEEKNKDRQDFEKYGNKAEVKAEEWNKEYPSISFNTVDKYVTKENISKVIVEESITFLCVDNHATRLLVQEHLDTLKDAVVISGGNSLEDGNVMILVRKNGEWKTPKFTDMHSEISTPREKNPGEMSCEELSKQEGGGQIAITNATIADHMRVTFYAMVENKIDYYEVMIDALTGKCLYKELEQPKDLKSECNFLDIHWIE